MASDNEASCDNDPNFAVICGFLEKFGATCGLSDIDFLDLQEMIENTQEVSKQLVDMHVKLLRKIRKSVSAERWEKSLVKLCHEFSSKDAWEIERFGYKKARLSSKLRVLKELLEMQFDFNTKFKSELNKLSAEELRCQPLGKDRNGCAYWFQSDENCQIRVYKEDLDEETWVLIAKDRVELVQLINNLSDNKSSVAASASASASDTVTNEDSTSLESDKLGIEENKNVAKEPIKLSNVIDPDVEDESVDWESEIGGHRVPKKCTVILSNIDKNDAEDKEVNEEKKEVGREKEEEKGDGREEKGGERKENDEESSRIEDVKTVPVEGEKSEEKQLGDPTKPLTIEIEDSNSVEDFENVQQEEEESEKKDVSTFPSAPIENEEESIPPAPMKPLLNLRIKPITELLSPNHLERITMRSDKNTDIAEFGRGPPTYVNPHASLHYGHNERKRSASVTASSATSQHVDEDPLINKKTRPTLLRPKSYSACYMDVSDTVEEPVVYVMGEGSGEENESGRGDDQEMIVVGEAVEEPVMYFAGEGSGADCDTGNEKRDKEGEDEGEQRTGCDNVGGRRTPPKQEYKLGTIYDTKTDKSQGIRTPVKNSRWDVGKPAEKSLETCSGILVNIEKCNRSDSGRGACNSDESTLNSCNSDSTIVPNEEAPSTTPPPVVVRRPVFFFGPGSLNISPTISPIKSKQNCDKTSLRVEKLIKTNESESQTPKSSESTNKDEVDLCKELEKTEISDEIVADDDKNEISSEELPKNPLPSKELHISDSIQDEKQEEVNDKEDALRNTEEVVHREEIPVEIDDKTQAAITDVDKVPISDKVEKIVDNVKPENKNEKYLCIEPQEKGDLTEEKKQESETEEVKNDEIEVVLENPNKDDEEKDDIVETPVEKSDVDMEEPRQIDTLNQRFEDKIDEDVNKEIENENISKDNEEENVSESVREEYYEQQQVEESEIEEIQEEKVPETDQDETNRNKIEKEETNSNNIVKEEINSDKIKKEEIKSDTTEKEEENSDKIEKEEITLEFLQIHDEELSDKSEEDVEITNSPLESQSGLEEAEKPEENKVFPVDENISKEKGTPEDINNLSSRETVPIDVKTAEEVETKIILPNTIEEEPSMDSEEPSMDSEEPSMDSEDPSMDSHQSIDTKEPEIDEKESPEEPKKLTDDKAKEEIKGTTSLLTRNEKVVVEIVDDEEETPVTIAEDLSFKNKYDKMEENETPLSLSLKDEEKNEGIIIVEENLEKPVVVTESNKIVEETLKILPKSNKQNNEIVLVEKKSVEEDNEEELEESQEKLNKKPLPLSSLEVTQKNKLETAKNLTHRTEITISKVKHYSSSIDVANNEILTITPIKKPKLFDNFEKANEMLDPLKSDHLKQVADVIITNDLKKVEGEILPNNIVDQIQEEQVKTSPEKASVITTSTKKEENDSKEPVNEPPCVKKFVPLLTDVEECEVRPESPLDSDSDILEVPEHDPLDVSDNDEEPPAAPAPEPAAAPLTFNSFKLDFHESMTPSPPPPRILTRNRKRAAEQSIDSLKETKKQEDVKRTKVKGKRAANKDIRRIVEEQKNTVSSSEEGGNEEGEVDESVEVISEEKSPPKKKMGRPRKVVRTRTPKAEKTESPAISSDLNSENSRTDACSTPPPNKKGRPRKKTLLGLEISDSLTNNNESLGSVRTSRRIAQIKIKEEAERRKMEEVTIQIEKSKTKKKGKKIEDDKEYKTHKKLQKKPLIAEEETTTMSIESESKRKKKKRKAGMVFSRKLYEEKNPWKYSSDDSSEEENEEEEEYEDMEPSEDEQLFKSDHEFSPESDLENDGEVQPLKRARTVKKESDIEDAVDDTNCQKCGKSDHPEWILLCDRCDNGWHCSCLRPALLVIPEGDWFCPPCQHISLVENLENKLIEFDKRLNKREMEVRRKERLAYVGISLDNVLPASTKEGEEHHHHHHHHPKKTKRSSEQGSDEEEEDDDDERSEGSDGSSSEESSSSSGDSDEPIYQLRQRRQAQTYRFNDYDELINSAIGEEMESVKGAGNKGRGKDIATIVNANKEEEEKRKLEMKFDERPPVVPQETHSTKEDKDHDEEVIKPKSKIFKGRKKSRKLNSLDVSSEDSDSDEDFKGSSLEEEEEVDEDFDSDSSSSRRARASLRRSTRARTARYDKDFINDESDSEEEAPSRKKTRSIWDESESEDSDKSWGGRRKKSKKSSFKLPSRSPKKSKKKKKKKGDQEYNDGKYRKKPKIKYGGLDNDEDNFTRGRRTRGKKINFLDALGTDSEEEMRNRKTTRKIEESEEEYVANEDEVAEDSELEKDEEINEEEDDDEEVDHELAKKIVKKRKNIIEDSEDESSGTENKNNEEMGRSEQPEVPVTEDSPMAETLPGKPEETPLQLPPSIPPQHQSEIFEKYPGDDPLPPSLMTPVPHDMTYDPKPSSDPIVMHHHHPQEQHLHLQQQLLLPHDLSKDAADFVTKDVIPWQSNHHHHPQQRRHDDSPIDEINKNFEDMNEEEMEKMMEEEEFANEQLKLVALQIEKERKKKGGRKSAMGTATGGLDEPKTPKKRGRKPKATLAACGGGIVGVGGSGDIVGGPSLHISPPGASLISPAASALSPNVPLPNIIPPMPASSSVTSYPTVSSMSPMIPQSIMRGSVSPAPAPYISSEPKENEELSEPPGATIPLFSEISPMGVALDGGTPKKRRGRGKGKKTLAKEQAAAAAAAAAAVGGGNNISADSSASTTPEQQPYPMTSNSSSPSANSPILSSKLTVAAPPQPFSQSQPIPSVITRMLQQHNNSNNAPATVGPKMYGAPAVGEPQPPVSSTAPPPVVASLPPNGIPVSTPPVSLQRQQGPVPSPSGPYHFTNSGQRGGPYGQLPPSASPYSVPRGAPLPSPHRMPHQQQQSQNLPPPIYHPHPMDPSPSGGGPINIPGPNHQQQQPQQERSSPSPAISSSKPDHQPPPPSSSSSQPQTYPRPQQQPPPPVGHYPPGAPSSMLSPRFVQQQHMASQLRPHPPFHPPGYHHPYGAPSYPPPIPASEEAQPPSDGGGAGGSYQGASQYVEPYGAAENSVVVPMTSSDNSNSRQYDEEDVGGEFGGLVSYFSSQREDDLET